MDESYPDDFTYHLVSKKGVVSIFRIKEITDETSVNEWVRKYSNQSKTTWRKAKTYPHTGRCNQYKVDFRCVHFTDRRAKGARSSKHTGCEAKLQLIVKRFREKTKSRRPDPLIKEYPCIVTLRGDHNHDLNTPTTLRYRDLDPEVKEKFCAMQRAGHTPSSALLLHKTDLKIQYKDRYVEVECDGQYVPTLSVVSKLFKKLCPSTRKRKPKTPVVETSQKQAEDEDADPASCVDASFEADDPPEENAVPPVDPSTNLNSEEQQQFYDFFQRIQKGLEDNPVLFVPAVRSLLNNEKRYASSEPDLLRALHLFGHFASVRKVSADNVRRRKRKKMNTTSTQCVQEVIAQPQDFQMVPEYGRPQNYTVSYQCNYNTFFNMG